MNDRDRDYGDEDESLDFEEIGELFDEAEGMTSDLLNSGFLYFVDVVRSGEPISSPTIFLIRGDRQAIFTSTGRTSEAAFIEELIRWRDRLKPEAVLVLGEGRATRADTGAEHDVCFVHAYHVDGWERHAIMDVQGSRDCRVIGPPNFTPVIYDTFGAILMGRGVTPIQ